MKSQDLEMCKINNTKINYNSSPIRSFSMYSIVSRYHHNEWIYVIWVNYLMVSINRFEEVTWFDFFTYWSDLCIHDNLVQQIDHLFLHMSLGRISSSFLLCNKVSYLVWKWTDTLKLPYFHPLVNFNHCSI